MFNGLYADNFKNIQQRIQTTEKYNTVIKPINILQ